jgi:hypothetical protein
MVKYFNSDSVQLAEQVAKLYIERFLRKKYYGVSAKQAETEYERTYYYDLDDEEYRLLEAWYEEEYKNYNNLQEYLESIEGTEDMIERMTPRGYCDNFDYISDCVLAHPEYFTIFTIQTFADEEQRKMYEPVRYEVHLSDDEYIELFCTCLLCDGKMSMNQMVCFNPEVSSKIMRHIIDTYYDPILPYEKPFITDAKEIREAVISVIDPEKDVLGLCKAEGELGELVRNHHLK